jgi:hypothetical protein
MRPRPIIISAIVIAAGIGIAAIVRNSAKQWADDHNCGNYLVAIGFAARVWADDHDGHFPPDLISMSNEVSTPKIYVCPGDHSRQPAASWASFTPKQSSFEIVTPSLRDGDTNLIFMRCKLHGSVLYGDGSVFVNGQRHYKY